MTGHTNFLQSLGWAVLNSLWQLALLWVAYQLITAVLKNSKASFKGNLASGLLIAGFSWFLYTFFTVYFSATPTQAVIESSFITTNNNEQVNDWLQKALPVASIIYLVLLAMPLLRFVRNYRYVQIIRKYGITKINVDWKIFINKVSAQMGIKKPVHIWVSELVSSPVTIGFLKPVILVPLAAINHLTPQQLEAVLLHELSHIKRYDYLINLIINFIKSILYFNPFAKAFVKIVEKEREKSCDDMVLQFQYDSHEYATALLMLEKTSHFDRPLIVGATGKKNDLLNRVELIMGISKQPAFSANRLAGVFAGLLFILSLNLFISLSKQVNGNRAASFAQMVLPFNFKTVSDEETTERSAAIINSVAKGKQENAVLNNNSSIAKHAAANVASEISTAYPVTFASYELPTVAIPELKKYQEDHVREALEASKKVLTSAQWKEVEKNIAEVFTQREKEQIKNNYQKEISGFDWKQWENKLRAAYNNVDWEQVNSQLAYAMSQVRMDSLQKVYSQALSEYDQLQKELKVNDIKGIPDTDITLNEIEQKKTEVKRVLNNIRGIRTKKIVHL